VGNLGDLLTGYSIVTGLAFVAITLLHGAVFLSIKVHGEPHARALLAARLLAPIAGAFVFAMVIWTHVVIGHGALLNLIELVALVAAVAAVLLVLRGAWGWAFTATAVTIASMVVTIFGDLYPNVLVSTIDPANNLTVHNTSSGPYSLKVMTIIVAVFLPIVLAYQAWTYYVLRRRLTQA
jgi:cytochrome bd ubiquinol oxidase subunit II